MPENNTTKQPRRENPPPISPPSRLTTYIGTPPLSIIPLPESLEHVSSRRRLQRCKASTFYPFPPRILPNRACFACWQGATRTSLEIRKQNEHVLPKNYVVLAKTCLFCLALDRTATLPAACRAGSYPSARLPRPSAFGSPSSCLGWRGRQRRGCGRRAGRRSSHRRWRRWLPARR